MDRNQRRPPDVNEALSSMLWTPYERTPSESSSDDDERLNAKLKKSKSTFDFSFPTKNNNNNNTTTITSISTTTTTTTQYVPSFRKIQRYDNFRFSYPYYGPVPVVQKCITELPSYESLYQNNATPELTSITGVQPASGAGRLVHSFTDNFLVQSRPSSAGALCDPSAALLGLTSSMSGFSNNFTDEEEYDDDDDYEDDEDFDESSTGNNNNRPSIASQSISMRFEELAQTISTSFSSSTGRPGCSVAPASVSAPSLGETNRLYEWPADNNQIAGVQSDNSGDLLLTENNNISQRHDQQQLVVKYEQYHYQQRQMHQKQQQPESHHHHHHHPKQHLQQHEHHSQQEIDNIEPDLRLAAQTMQPTATIHGEDRDDASDELEDLPGEITESATLPSTTTITTTIPPKRPLSVSEQKHRCNNTTGEKPDTKCVRSVQTDLVLSSSRLVEANVGFERVVPSSLSRSSVRKFVDFFANASAAKIDSATRSNCDIRWFASSGESDCSNVINDTGAIRDQRQPLILDVRNTLLAMRLNIPAAQPSFVDPLKGTSIVGHNNNNNNNNGNSGIGITTTSVFLPLNESLIASRIVRTRNSSVSNVNAVVSTTTAEVNGSSTGVAATTTVHSKPSLTIQVNQGVDNRVTARDSVEGFANQCAGISVVSCYSGSTVPNSCSINNNNKSVANVVTTSTTSTTTTANIPTTVTNSVNITSANGRGECDNNKSGATTTVQTNGLHTTTTTSSSSLSEQQQQGHHSDENHHRPLARTFTSTECQTDDLPLVDRNEIQAVIAQSQTEALISREHRRRERRERRAQGRIRHPHILPPMHHHPAPPPPPPPLIRPSMLPDILHSHFPPPYTALHSMGHPPPPPPPPAPMLTPVISTVPIATATAVNDGRFTIPLPVIRRSPSERSGKGCCGQWFAGPPLRALIAVVALGGVACALGGAALGATGLAGPPTSHLTAALLMIGVGVILVTVSGAAWRMTAPGGPPCLGLGSTVDLARCGRRPCNSRGAPHGLLYPEFQHRPPPPSYQASMQEYRLRLLLLDRDRQNGVVRGGSPPPTYRSHAGSLLRAPLSTTRNGSGDPGSEYSLPPSYRSRNNNTLARLPTMTAGLSDDSIPTSSRNLVPSTSNRSTNHPSTNSDVNVPPNNTTTTTTSLLDQYHNTVSSSSADTTSSVQVNFPSSSTLGATTITTPSATLSTTKDSIHTTIAIEAAANGAGAATRPNELQQHHQQNFSLINQSQNLNEKLNPRVTSSNNVNFSNNSRTSNSIPSSSSSISNSGSHSCTKMSGSPSKSFVTTTATTTLTSVASSRSAEQSCAPGNGGRKELVTIVTISASQEPDQSSSPSEMEILAHL